MNSLEIINISSTKISLPSVAKLNLFLHVYQKREDGYHDLETYFQLIDLHDRIEIESICTKDIKVENPKLDIKQEDDLCYKAAILLQKHCNINKGAIIKVDKKIPDGGGLGGGSSNAATVLIGLNYLWKAGLSNKELQSLGLILGSDVPIFIHGTSSYSYSRGEKFLEQENDFFNNNQNFIVTHPNVSVSTSKIFNSKMLTKRLKKSKIASVVKTANSNDFEYTVFSLYPDILKAKLAIEEFFPAYLTGTGSCLYSMLDLDEKADKITQKLSSKYNLFLCKAISNSPLHNLR